MGEEIEKSIRNLKQYIKEDPYFNRTSKIETDFDKFCYNHCKDIENLLEENKIQRKQLNDAFNNGWIHKNKINYEIKNLENRKKYVPLDNRFTYREVIEFGIEELKELLKEKKEQES